MMKNCMMNGYCSLCEKLQQICCTLQEKLQQTYVSHDAKSMYSFQE